jgi:DNA gyrase subunit B
MPEVIERGYLYIAQPPLYRGPRGKSEIYLKDDPALDHHLITQALEDAIFVGHAGEQVAGQELRGLVEQGREVKRLLDSIARKVGSPMVVEQAAIAGAFNPEVLGDEGLAAAAAEYIAQRLDVLAPPLERGWRGKPASDGGLTFTRTLRGVAEVRRLTGELAHSAEAMRLDAMAADLQATYAHPGRLRYKEQDLEIAGPVGLVDRIMQIGRKGVAIQRYKGLGEMNPEQLWETTLDPNSRLLLQVKVHHADEAEEIFSTLMGDLVDPRREFIQDNALKVANLDV